MTLNEALEIVKDNFNTNNNSFLDFAHERRKFEEIKFWEFYNSIRIITLFNQRKTLDRELTTQILGSYEWFLILINFHFDKADQSELSNLPTNFSQYSLRLREAIDGYISGNIIDDKTEENFNEDLLNPISIEIKKTKA
jgi:hypothetical protein